MLPVGTPAPSFELPSTNGEPIRLEDYRGMPLVLYFYPEDHTLGCTYEARGFRAYFESYKRCDVAILGISRDNYDNHCSFQAKHGLPFQLLSDEDEKIHDAYDAWRHTRIRGRRVMHRCTYIVSPEGEIVKTYGKVNIISHARQVLEDVEAIGKERGWFPSLQPQRARR